LALGLDRRRGAPLNLGAGVLGAGDIASLGRVAPLEHLPDHERALPVPRLLRRLGLRAISRDVARVLRAERIRGFLPQLDQTLGVVLAQGHTPVEVERELLGRLHAAALVRVVEPVPTEPKPQTEDRPAVREPRPQRAEPGARELGPDARLHPLLAARGEVQHNAPGGERVEAPLGASEPEPVGAVQRGGRAAQVEGARDHVLRRDADLAAAERPGTVENPHVERGRRRGDAAQGLAQDLEGEASPDRAAHAASHARGGGRLAVAHRARGVILGVIPVDPARSQPRESEADPAQARHGVGDRGQIPGRGERQQTVVHEKRALVLRREARRVHVDRERIERQTGEAARRPRARPTRGRRQEIGRPRGLARGARAGAEERGEEKR
jgi:hypothetical protein